MSHVANGVARTVIQKRESQLVEFANSLGLPAPVHIGCGIFCCVGEITPQVAEIILARHHIDNNRSKKSGAIIVFSSDMQRGRWRLSHQGIAFNQNDRLFDGQNRLVACLRSGVTFRTKVTFNVGDNAMVNTDTGTIRSGTDAARILGVTLDGAKVTSRIAATANVMARGPYHMKTSIECQMEVLRIFREPLRFLLEQFPNHIKRVTIGPVLGALGRAYLHEDKERMIELCNAMKSGYVEDPARDSAAIVLTRFLQTTNLAGSENQAVAYFKAENGIHNFCRREKITKLYAAGVELYPLPIEIQQKLESLTDGAE